jgi:hypothetical protein
MALLFQDDVSARRPNTAIWRRLRYVELGLAACGLAAAILILLDVSGAPWAAFKLVVCLALPGWIILSRLPTADPAARLVWTAAASVVVLWLPPSFSDPQPPYSLCRANLFRPTLAAPHDFTLSAAALVPAVASARSFPG